MFSDAVILTKTSLCEEKLRLMEDFMSAASELVSVHNAQMKALLEDDPDFSRFDVLIHLASERKRMAKYSYMVHIEKHRC